MEIKIDPTLTTDGEYQPPTVTTPTGVRLTLGEAVSVGDVLVSPVIFDGKRMLAQVEGPEDALKDANLRRALGSEIEQVHVTVANGCGRWYAEYWIPFLGPRNGFLHRHVAESRS